MKLNYKDLKKEKDDLFKKIINDYRDKAKEVNKKYVDSAISGGFACVYIPSESLYHEVTTHVNEDKELWISKSSRCNKCYFYGSINFCGLL